MAQVAKVSATAEIQSCPEKIYNFLKYESSKITSIAPQIVKKAELIQGNEGEVGCIKRFEYELGVTLNIKIIWVNDSQKIIIGAVVEGEILHHYTQFKVTVTIKKNVAEWSIEYEKANPSVPDPDTYATILVQTTKAIDAYLLIN